MGVWVCGCMGVGVPDLETSFAFLHRLSSEESVLGRGRERGGGRRH